jgi:hypothetical protein
LSTTLILSRTISGRDDHGSYLASRASYQLKVETRKKATRYGNDFLVVFVIITKRNGYLDRETMRE